MVQLVLGRSVEENKYLLVEILCLDLEDLKLSKSDEEERERQKKRRVSPPFIKS